MFFANESNENSIVAVFSLAQSSDVHGTTGDSAGGTVTGSEGTICDGGTSTGCGNCGDAGSVCIGVSGLISSLEIASVKVCCGCTACVLFSGLRFERCCCCRSVLLTLRCFAPIKDDCLFEAIPNETNLRKHRA